jgi:tungstate transport system ATP-binding protein
MSRSPTGLKPVIEAKDLSMSYGEQKVLDVPAFQVFRNEVLVIIGPNGSGKTTLLLCLTRLIHPQTGTVSYDGTPVLDSKAVLELHRKLAVVFQESLLLNSSVWDNVTLGLRLRNMKNNEAKTNARKWLERFGIAHLARRQARTLSSGEAKRASLARAFALQPEVLFLDEPFTALDSPTRQALLEDFEGVLRETRVTTVMVTHDRNEALALADRVVVLMDGRIGQIGTPAEVFSSPVNEGVAGFVEAGNILRGVVSVQNGGLASIQVENQHIEAASDFPVGTDVIVLLPYDDVTINLPSPEKMTTSARNRLSGVVVKIFPIGSQVRVSLDCGFPLVALITRRSAEEMGLQKGTMVYAAFKAVSTHVIKRH